MNKLFSVIIVDDEYWARKNLSTLLSNYEQIKIVGMAATVKEARDLINQLKPDGLFLDIQLREGIGFDVLAGVQNPPLTVFVTAFDTFALRAFEVNALDYLLKPIDASRLSEAVKRLLSRWSSTEPIRQTSITTEFNLNDQILISADTGQYLILVNKIASITSAGNYTLVMTTQKDMVLKCRETLKNWLTRLPSPPFLQLDRSKIVNTSIVSALNTNGEQCVLHFEGTGETLNLGRVAKKNMTIFLSGRFTDISQSLPT